VYNWLDVIANKDRLYDWFVDNSNKVPTTTKRDVTHNMTCTHTGHRTRTHDTQYGGVWAVTGPGKPWIVAVNDPESVDHILRTNFENYVKSTSTTPTITASPH
jgi:hypothetical protein